MEIDASGRLSAGAPVTAALLASLDTITHEATQMLNILDDAHGVWQSDRYETKRFVLEIRARAQELFDRLSEARLEEPRN